MEYMHKSIKINQVELSNRLVMPPMATSKSIDGSITPELLEYYDIKSKGGYIGLIITEHAYVNQQGMASKCQISIAKDDDVEGLKQLTNVIHRNHSKVIAQISHAGSSANPQVTGMSTISASAVFNEGITGKNNVLPEAMTQAQIDEVVMDFTSAAKRAKQAGFDGVEIHSAHGYLLNQFYSPLTNKRLDAYTGATMEGRLKFLIDILKAVRKEVGQDYLIAIRLGGCDYSIGGSTIEDSVKAAKILESNGVDLLDISGGFNGYMIPGCKEQGYFSKMTESIKKEVSVPVILTGGITEMEFAEKLLVENKADLIGVGRTILKDSTWAKKNLTSFCAE